jgi:hypothetical protein
MMGAPDLRTMDLPITDKPGRRVRHLRRRHRNPLFAWPPVEVEPEALLAAQKADYEEMEAFRDAFRAQVQKAVDLQPDAGSEPVHALEEELAKLYEQACGLPEDQEREKDALARLIGLIMKAVRKAAGEDALARRELDDGEQARAIHFRLLRQPLVADILHPESTIGPDELVPALLSADEQELEAALEVFDADQLALLVAQGGELLDGLERSGADTLAARRRLALLEKGSLTKAAGPTSQ